MGFRETFAKSGRRFVPLSVVLELLVLGLLVAPSCPEVSAVRKVVCPSAVGADASAGVLGETLRWTVLQVPAGAQPPPCRGDDDAASLQVLVEATVAVAGPGTCEWTASWQCSPGCERPPAVVRGRTVIASGPRCWTLAVASFTMPVWSCVGCTLQHECLCSPDGAPGAPAMKAQGQPVAMVAHLDVRRRSDSGRPNTPPWAALPLVLRISSRCLRPLRVSTWDEDGDLVRCRYATQEECGACDAAVPGITLHEECAFTFGSSRHAVPGKFVVSVVVEDFPTSSSVGPNGPAKARALSSVPLQFTLIVVSQADGDCFVEPAFTGRTPKHGAVFRVVAGTRLDVLVDVSVSRHSQGGSRWPSAELLVVCGGALAGDVVSDPATPGLLRASLLWVPPAGDGGGSSRRICFYAEDSAGRQSEVRCFTVVVTAKKWLSFKGARLPGGGHHSGRPRRGLMLPGELRATGFTVAGARSNAETVNFTVTFNQEFSPTRVAAFVRLVSVRSGHEALRLDARTAAVRASPAPRTVAFAAPPFSLRGGERYCVTLDEGVVQLKASNVRINSQPHPACDWVFALPRKVYASCYAQCDPHFKSFDGRLFDYMGTKPVLLAGLCEPTGTDDEGWAVYGKSEHWGSRRVSWMESVVVEVHGYRVTLEQGYVKVDGAFVNMPYMEPDFKFKIYSSNHYFVLRTNLHFSVKFGASRVVVELENAALYRGALCGLCGNYNGRKDDDWQLPGQGATLTAHDFGNYWISGSIRMSGVPDDGSSSLLQLNASLVAVASEGRRCGLLTDPRGPLAVCAGTVSPAPYFSDCVYDMSAEEGVQAYVALCLALQAYSDDCYAAGVPVDPRWRTVTGCELSCGPMPRSVLSLAASSCPATCADPDAGLDCGDPVVEDCVCVPGHLWDKTRCVEPAACGCVVDGKYYSIGEKFFNEDCSEHCACLERERVDCKPVSCEPPLQHCGVNEYGTHGCLHSWMICSSGGSQHYATFDGRAYEFYGTYTYALAMTRNVSSSGAWRVLLKNSPVPGSFIQSRPKAVYIEIAGLEISFLTGKRVLVNGRSAQIPFYHPDTGSDPEVVLSYAGNHLLLEARVGLRVLFDGRHVLVAALATHAGLVEGLCGNLDGDASNDMRLPSGVPTSHAGTFGDSWRVSWPWDSGFEQGQAKLPSVVNQELATRPLWCGRLLDAKLFGVCHEQVAVQPYWQRCVWHVRHSAKPAAMRAALCASLDLYSVACALRSVALPDWRTAASCALPRCPPGSHYEACAPGCPSTCAVPTADGLCPVRPPCLDGCVCNFGRVWSGDRCILPAQCGCVAGSSYYQAGSLFLNRNCTELCSCRTGGAVVCSAFRCSGQCVLEDGEYLCSQRIKRCQVTGDAHYSTFDGTALDVDGTCSYALVSVAQRPDFSVYARHERSALPPHATVVVGVYVRVQSTTIALERGFNVYLNGVRQNLPLFRIPFTAFENARDIVVLGHDLDFLVRYNGWASFSIEVGPGLAGATAGLCGDNDGQPDNVTNAVGSSSPWLIRPVDSAACVPLAPPAPVPRLPPPPSLRLMAAAQAACAVLSDPAGPFAVCHVAVSPAWWAGVCASAPTGGDGQEARCRVMHAYHTRCRLRRVFVGEWRTVTGCDEACPVNSRLETCTSVCPPSCAMTTSDCEWPCISGCQCKRGFFRQGGTCVPPEGCGCFDGSSYYAVGRQFRESDCSTLYTCHGNRSLTQRRDPCAPGHKCQLQDGDYGCVAVDEMTVGCFNERMMVSISKRLVLGQNVSSLALISSAPGCELRDTGPIISFNISLRECGTIFRQMKDYFVFKQTVTLKNISANIITYEWLTVIITAVCKIPRRKLLNGDPFRVNTTSIALSQVVYSDLHLRMDLFQKPDFARRYEPLEYPVAVRLRQPLYLQVSIRTGLELAAFTVDCVATPGSSPQDPYKAYLVRDGCLQMDTVNLTLSDVVRRFSFKAFGFAGSKTLYVHCSTIVCGRTKAASRCRQGCLSQRRRKEAAEAVDGDEETTVFLLTRGPFLWEGHDDDKVAAVETEDTDSQGTFAAVAGIFAALLLFLVLLGGVLCIIEALCSGDAGPPGGLGDLMKVVQDGKESCAKH
ncbi:zonadhesin-like isoform X1 [Lampetra planeri]